MSKEATDRVLADMDALLADIPLVACWRCQKAPGAPSLCVGCHSEVGYEKPPKGTERVPWLS